MGSWEALRREFDNWGEAGRKASLWWRDDDAAEDTPALRRLLSIAGTAEASVALAVVPARLSESLRSLLRHPDSAFAVPVQHGYAHENHAPAGEKKSEFPAGRDRAAVRDEIASGLARAKELPRFVPAFVPPWNRGLDTIRPVLRDLGFAGVSTFGPRETTGAKPIQVNTHVDIVDWRGGRGFVGMEPALDRLIGHLRDRRAGRADADEPTGILSHHLVHDDGCWAFLEELFRQTRHAAARWLGAGEVFGS